VVRLVRLVRVVVPPQKTSTKSPIIINGILTLNQVGIFQKAINYIGQKCPEKF
jgi:hypothetical protein